MMMKNNIKTISEFVVKENIKKYDSERLSFLSHISHGIRTPLNAIMGFSKLLVLRELNDGKQKEYAKGILTGGNLLLQFVDNIMDLSQFEANNYSLRIVKCDLNQVIWEYTEDFYNHKIENDTNISLMLVWDSKVNDLEIETDPVLLKKAIQRLINIVSVKYSIEEFEMGYRCIENGSVNIFVRPATENLSEAESQKEHALYTSAENDSFDYFNYKVLEESVSKLRGKLSLSSDNQEYSFSVPLKYV